MLRIGMVLLGLIMVQALAACGILVVGGVAGTAAVMSDRRSPGIQAIDVGIEYEAGNKLSQLFGDNAHVNVTAFNQKVLLTGEAKDENIKAEAGSGTICVTCAPVIFASMRTTPPAPLHVIVSKLLCQYHHTESGEISESFDNAIAE